MTAAFVFLLFFGGGILMFAALIVKPRSSVLAYGLFGVGAVLFFGSFIAVNLAVVLPWLAAGWKVAEAILRNLGRELPLPR